MEFGGCPIEQEAAREKSPYRSFLVLAELKTRLTYPAELNPRAFRRLQQNTEGGWPVREKRDVRKAPGGLELASRLHACTNSSVPKSNRITKHRPNSRISSSPYMV